MSDQGLWGQSPGSAALKDSRKVIAKHTIIRSEQTEGTERRDEGHRRGVALSNIGLSVYDVMFQ